MGGQKHNTMACIIWSFVREEGFVQVTPDDLSEYPDYPRKPDDMSKEDYYAILKQYWNKKKVEIYNRKRKAARELKAQDILEKMMPEDLTGHPNFPEYLDGVTLADYAHKVEIYWIKRRKEQEPKKLKMNDFSEEEQKNIFDECMKKSRRMTLEKVAIKHSTIVRVINEIISKQQKDHTNPVPTSGLNAKTKTVHSWWTFYEKVKDKYPDYPKRNKDISEEDFQEAMNA